MEELMEDFHLVKHYLQKRWARKILVVCPEHLKYEFIHILELEKVRWIAISLNTKFENFDFRFLELITEETKSEYDNFIIYVWYKKFLSI